MADSLDPSHKPHEASLAMVAGQSKVSGFEFPQGADFQHGRDESMMRLEDAQKVSGQKDGFEPTEEQPISLESGPAKTIIPVPEQPSTTIPSSSYSASNTMDEDPFAGAGDAQDTAQPDDPFGGVDLGGSNGNDQQPPPSSEDQSALFGSMDPSGGADAIIPATSNDADVFGGMSYGDDEEKEAVLNDDEQEETFLSVWKAKRAKVLEEREQAERNSKAESEETGKEEIRKFYEQRTARIDSSRQQIQDQQETIRQELNSVFETGTIWEQVARLCDLNKTDPKVERMRNLLIELKNSQ